MCHDINTGAGTVDNDFRNPYNIFFISLLCISLVSFLAPFVHPHIDLHVSVNGILEGVGREWGGRSVSVLVLCIHREHGFHSGTCIQILTLLGITENGSASTQNNGIL